MFLKLWGICMAQVHNKANLIPDTFDFFRVRGHVFYSASACSNPTSKLFLRKLFGPLFGASKCKFERAIFQWTRFLLLWKTSLSNFRSVFAAHTLRLHQSPTDLSTPRQARTLRPHIDRDQPHVSSPIMRSFYLLITPIQLLYCIESDGFRGSRSHLAQNRPVPTICNHTSQHCPKKAFVPGPALFWMKFA